MNSNKKTQSRKATFGFKKDFHPINLRFHLTAIVNCVYFGMGRVTPMAYTEGEGDQVFKPSPQYVHQIVIIILRVMLSV